MTVADGAYPRRCSDSDVLFSLEREHRARLGRRRDLETEFIEQAADLGDLFGIAGREPAAPDAQGVPETDSNVAAKHGRLRDQRHLMSTRGQRRPNIVAAEQTVRRAAHEYDVIGIGADPAEDAEH